MSDIRPLAQPQALDESQPMFRSASKAGSLVGKAGTSRTRATMHTALRNEQKHVPNHGSYTAAEYQRNPNHVANTGQDEESYVLALLTDKAHHQRMTGLRNKYFPPHINKLEAHIALFRALPGSRLSQITEDLQTVTQNQRKFQIIANKPFRLGHGIGINVQKSAAEDIFQELKLKWGSFLSKQDQSFAAHYTVQNKVDSQQEVDRALSELKESFQQSEGTAEGLALYRYVKGYWKDRKDFLFRNE